MYRSKGSRMARCCQPGLNDPAILGYYEFNECYCRHSILSCCCTKQWIAPGEGCINNKDFDVHDWERGTRLRTEFERLLTSVHYKLSPRARQLPFRMSAHHFHHKKPNMLIAPIFTTKDADARGPRQSPESLSWLPGRLQVEDGPRACSQRTLLPRG